MGETTLRQALEEFKNIHLASRNYASRSREEYINDLEDLITFLEGMGFGHIRGIGVVLESDASLCLPDLEESRHGATGKTFSKSGSSNYAFGDGSVRAIRFGESLCPLNLWAVTERGRTDYAVCRPK